jgi:DNA gyrase subunit B
LKEYIRYLDVNREPIIAHVIPWMKREIPVEVLFTIQVILKIFFLRKHINTHEGGTLARF